VARTVTRRTGIPCGLARLEIPRAAIASPKARQ
jgi:hypothetical protein